MAAMKTLTPMVTVNLAPGWDLHVTAAGVLSTGLTADVALVNGTAQSLDQVRLADQRHRDAYAEFIHIRTNKALPRDDVMTKLLALTTGVLGALQQRTPKPPTPGTGQLYTATPEGILWRKSTQNGDVEVLLANFTAEITEDITTDDGAETRRVFGMRAEHCGRTLTYRVPAAQFASLGWVTEHLGAQAILMPGTALKDHARAAIQTLSTKVVRRHTYTHLGWRQIQGEWVYLHAGGAIGKDGPVAGIDVALDGELQRYELMAPASQDDARAAIQKSLHLLQITPGPLVYAGYAAVWRAPLGHTDHSLHFTGRTGAGKTALVGLLQQHYGCLMDADGLPGSWSSTGNALEALNFLAKDALLAIDDFCPTGSQTDIQRLHRDADRVFRGQGNSRGRGRMRPDGTLRPPRPPRALVMSTGEDIPLGQSLRARMLILDTPPQMLREQKALFTACQADAASGVYSMAMAGFLQWLAPQYDLIRASMPQAITELREQASQQGHLRTPEITAQLGVGLQTFFLYAATIGAITGEEAQAYWAYGWQSLCALGTQQGSHQEGEDEVSRFIAALQGALAKGDAHIASAEAPGEPQAWPEWGWRQDISQSDDGVHAPRTITAWRGQGGCIGWCSGDRVYLEPEASYSVAERFAVSQKRSMTLTANTLWKRMGEQGLLLRTKSQSKNVVKRTIGGARPYVIDIAASLLVDKA